MIRNVRHSNFYFERPKTAGGSTGLFLLQGRTDTFSKMAELQNEDGKDGGETKSQTAVHPHVKQNKYMIEGNCCIVINVTYVCLVRSRFHASTFIIFSRPAL